MSRTLDLFLAYEKLPQPRACGADLRIVQVIEELARAGHRVHFLGRNPAGDERDRAEIEQMCERVHSPDPGRIHWARLPHPELDLEGLFRAHRFDAVILDQFFWTGLSVTEQYLPLARRWQPHAPVIVLSDDCHWLREERRAEREGSRSALERSRALFAKERWTLESADLAAAITSVDQERLTQAFPAARFAPLSFCQTEIPESTPAFEARRGLVFLGTGSNEANVHGITWFVREVWPLVRARRPELELDVVGAPPAAGWGVENAPGVRVRGRLDELGPVLGAARVFVSPVAWGTGIKTKNVQALAHGLPLVLNAISAEGMQLEPDSAGFVREDPAGFAAAVLALHDDAALWTRASHAALEHARRWFGRERVADDLAALLDEALSRPARAELGRDGGPGTFVERRFPELCDARSVQRRYQGLKDHARELASAGRTQEAVSELRNVFCELVAMGPTESVYCEAHTLLAQQYARSGQFDEAAAAAAEALRHLPEHAQSARPVLERVMALAGR